MEILNTPSYQENPETLFEVVCQKCGADIRFSRSEALTETTNKTSTILEIDCPSCNNKVFKTLNKKVVEQVVTIEEYHTLPI